MRITSRFTIAVHTLIAIHTFENQYKTTSEFIASSVNVNPVIVRRIMQNLKAAGIVKVHAGSGGATIVKALNDITLYDIYRAVDCLDAGLFHFHEKPNQECPVGKSIHTLLDAPLANAQTAMENELKKVTLQTLTRELDTLLQNR